MVRKSDAEQIIKAALSFYELTRKSLFEPAATSEFTKMQTNIVSLLFVRGPMNMSSLSAHMGVAPEQTSRNVRMLREDGYVECDKDADNRRKVIARLTSKGERLAEKQLESAREHLNALFKKLTDAEVRELAKLSMRIDEILSEVEFA